MEKVIGIAGGRREGEGGRPAVSTSRFRGVLVAADEFFRMLLLCTEAFGETSEGRRNYDAGPTFDPTHADLENEYHYRGRVGRALCGAPYLSRLPLAGKPEISRQDDSLRAEWGPRYELDRAESDV